MEQGIQRNLAKLTENYLADCSCLEEQQKRLVDEKRSFLIRLTQLQKECQRSKHDMANDCRSARIDALVEQAYMQGDQVVKRAQKNLENKAIEIQKEYQRRYILLKEKGGTR